MSEESPIKRSIASDKEALETSGEIEHESLDLEKFSSGKSGTPEKDEEYQIQEIQLTQEESDQSIHEFPHTELKSSESNSELPGSNAKSEPVTVLIDPQEANKNYLIELEVAQRKSYSETEKSILENTIFSSNARLDHPYYNKDYKDKNSTHKGCLPHRNTCLCIFAYGFFLSYLWSGAALFFLLEGNEESSKMVDISSLKNDTAILLATELRQVSPYEPIWAQYIFKHLEIFEENLMRASGVEDWRKAKERGFRKWTRKTSLFYSLSLMTRTGYCSMSPKSKWGRTVTVCYTLFAVPLTLAWFLITGRALAHAWSGTLDVLCCSICNIRCGRNKTMSKKSAKRNSNSITPMDPELDRMFKAMADNEKMKFREMRSAASARSIVSMRSVAHQRSRNEIQPELKLISMDQAVSIVFAVLFFVVYFVIGSALTAIREDFPITDCLYFNFLMLATIGPTCELDNSLFEGRISNRMCHFCFLYFGYSILSMIFYLIFTFYFPSFDSKWIKKRIGESH